MGYIFPDQIETIKNRSEVALHKYVKGKTLRVGSPWFCIACDQKQSDGKRCKIVGEMTGEEARKKIEIRKRETNLEAMGFVFT
jgi:hypothetical protein